MDHLIGETVLGKAYIKGTSDEDVICFVKDIAKCAEKRDPELLQHALSNSGWEWFSVIPRAKIITRKVLPDGGTERGRETLNETISRIKERKESNKRKEVLSILIADIRKLSLVAENNTSIEEYKSCGEELYCVTEKTLAKYKAISIHNDKGSLQLIERKIAVFRLAMNMDLKGNFSLTEIADQLKTLEKKDFKTDYVKMLLSRVVRYVRLNAGDEYRCVINKFSPTNLLNLVYYGIAKEYSWALAKLIISCCFDNYSAEDVSSGIINAIEQNISQC